ncbi:MAG TPA: hypothetical protein VFL86_27800 [Burkholderiaceae bacterium]|nr:hypothetical protein [Burkholderiaceae bacterium]
MNQALVQRVFRSLDDSYHTDADDVPVPYVEHLGRDPALRAVNSRQSVLNAAADCRTLAESRRVRMWAWRRVGVLRGCASIPHERALTAFVGHAQKDAGPDEVINVDVICKVFGAREDLRNRAVLGEAAVHLGRRHCRCHAKRRPLRLPYKRSHLRAPARLAQPEPDGRPGSTRRVR